MIQNYFPDDDEETLIDIPINAQEFEEYVNCDKDTECFGPTYGGRNSVMYFGR